MLCRNIPHPECLSNEYYIGNYTLDDYEKITLRYKRIGKLNLSSDGVPLIEGKGIDKTYPVFVDKDEVKATRHSEDYWGRVFFENGETDE